MAPPSFLRKTQLQTLRGIGHHQWRAWKEARLAILLILTVLNAISSLTFAQERPQAAVFSGLGHHSRPVTTSSEQAQLYFNQGLNFLFAFNHDEAIRSFEQAAQLDPDCAMAWWGVAIACGPHINNPILPPERAAKAWEAWQKAKGLAPTAGSVEQALIGALGKRYAADCPAERQSLDEAYAAAMKQVWQSYPADADVGALYAEALMDLRPWDLWQPDGTPQPGTEEIVETLENVLRLMPQHPLALHLYIHAVEASPDPARADDEADRLRKLQPGLGHMVHMPSHIDVRRGRWAEAVAANQRAIEADRTYRAKSPDQKFYRLYMAHNYHMLAYASIMRGQSQLATEAITEMIESMPESWVRENTAIADGFVAMPLEVLVRFGRWDQILEAPEPPDYLPLARSLRHYARAIAFAAQDKTDEATREKQAFLQSRTAVAEDATFGNNRAHDLLDVAESLMNGEILYRQGQVDAGLQAMREAVEREDRLRYDEPPDWIHPVRHALGATLLQEKRASEAERVYREDLARLPLNGWSLFGLSQSLEMQGKHDESVAVRKEFDGIWQAADVQLYSSCFCQPGR